MRQHVIGILIAAAMLASAVAFDSQYARDAQLQPNNTPPLAAILIDGRQQAAALHASLAGAGFVTFYAPAVESTAASSSCEALLAETHAFHDQASIESLPWKSTRFVLRHEIYADAGSLACRFAELTGRALGDSHRVERHPDYDVVIAGYSLFVVAPWVGESYTVEHTRLATFIQKSLGDHARIARRA